MANIFRLFILICALSVFSSSCEKNNKYKCVCKDYSSKGIEDVHYYFDEKKEYDASVKCEAKELELNVKLSADFVCEIE